MLFARLKPFRSETRDLSGLARAYALLLLVVGFLAFTMLRTHALQFSILVPYRFPGIVEVVLLFGACVVAYYNAPDLEVRILSMGIFGVYSVLLIFGSAFPKNQQQVAWQNSARLNGPVSGDQVSVSSPAIPLPADTMARKKPGDWQNSAWALPRGTEPAAVVPTTGFHWRILDGLPMYDAFWSGDFLVWRDGTFEWLDSKDAQGDPRLRGVPLYPRELTNDLLAGWRWMHRSGTGEVDWSSGQAVLVSDQGRMYWVVPFVVDQQIRKLLFVDARTGAADVRGNGASFVTAAVARDAAKKVTPDWPWAASASSPTQVVFQGMSLRDDRLYWHWSDVSDRGPKKDVWVAGDNEAVSFVNPVG